MATITMDENGRIIGVRACENCGGLFLTERLEKHEKNCKG